jgi:UDP-arabinose 4-epimerase
MRGASWFSSIWEGRVSAILVTGGAGYIGSHTAKLISRSGRAPITIDDLSTGNAWAVRHGPLVQANVGDRAALRQLFLRHEIEAVIHFAASAYVGESVRSPRHYFSNNVTNTLALLDTMLECDVRRIVFSSTCATYGDPLGLPIDEGHPQRPVNPYGESKLFIERALHWYGQAYGLQWVALRYFNAAGADPDGELGECHVPETHLVPLALLAASGVTPPLKIFGKDYPTSDGTAVRDYVHVADLAKAHLLALGYLAAGHPSRAFNLGTGRGHSVAEVVRATEMVTGRVVPVEYTARRAGDPAALVADATLARAALGWQPEFAGIEPLVETAWRWHSSAGEGRSRVSLG